MKNKLSITASAFLAALVLFSPASGHAKPSPTPGATGSATALSPTASAVMKPRPISFHGMVTSVDEKAKTFTVASKEKTRSLRVTDKTVITKLGLPATMKDIVANQEIRGTCSKVSDASFDAKMLKLGPLTEAEKAAEDSHKERRVEKKIGSPPAASPTASASTVPKA
jgi:hypothetical protein